MALALDWYLKIDDVHGDATDYYHRNWIETYSWKTHKAQPAQLIAVILVGTASARLVSAMKTGHKFMRAQLHGVLNGKAVEGFVCDDLRVIEFIPAGRHKNGPLMQVTFQYNVR